MKVQISKHRKKISENFEFKNEDSFRNTFKKVTGYCPKEYRKIYGNKYLENIQSFSEINKC